MERLEELKNNILTDSQKPQGTQLDQYVCLSSVSLGDVGPSADCTHPQDKRNGTQISYFVHCHRNFQSTGGKPTYQPASF